MFKKKIDIILVVDRSGSLSRYRERINRALTEMVRVLKTSEDLSGCDVYLSVISFSDDMTKNIEFKPINSVSVGELSLTFGGETNPGPALKYIVEKAYKRYQSWRDHDEECFHPFLAFFTDGYPYPKAKYQTKYEEAARYIRDLESRDKLLVVGAGFGDANIDNIKLLTTHPDRVLSISDRNVTKMSDFFKCVIPITINHTVTGEIDVIDKLFRRFNECA